MSNVTVPQAEEYLKMVGSVETPNVNDREWILVLASAYRMGFIRDLDWDSILGAKAMGLIEDSWEGYQKWLSDEEIDPQKVL